MIRFALIILSIVAVSCSTTKPEADATQPVASAPVVSKPTVNRIPKARIYKTNGDYRQNVPITVKNGNITSFPDVADITPSVLPIELADGYLLDRRGISEHAAFTSYTYETYSTLEKTPSADTLKAAIIPGATVVEIIQLPFDTPTAVADTARCNRLIRDGLPGCKVVKRNISIQL